MANKRVKPQHVAEYALLRVLGGILRNVPVDAASWTMGRVMGALMPLMSRHERAKEHMALAMPELSEPERDRIARGMWRQLGRVAGEAFQIDTILADDSRITLPDGFDELVDRCRDGCVVATAHLGNWEVAGAVAHRGGKSLAGVYQALHNPLADGYLRRLREPVYPAGLFGKGGDLGTRLVGLVRQGAAVGIVADLREKRGIEVEFFGQPAFATPLPAMLARLSGRPLVAGAVVREGGVHFRTVCQIIDVPHTEDRNRDVQVATQRLHDAFETWIRANPEQWMWTHRKWARSKARPLGVKTLLDADASS
ncbi:lysophospholipid acyltransferase family protein [Acuticoccus sp. I52.16.1]|uniref:lysophospholipid acyltransferase family protein n=1 Tax=Acuticoccus sp. I52.16.1 TaxID=2928472 RepID=UPI001FD0F5C7|nr:lauroyl acyltransferase [Acuticoccus sp. I52.16.1]UOM34567.1 lauroyl acyltransferase [Acuticoccus sp. I52.16.1]